MQVVFALLGDVGAGNKARHADIAAEVIVADGMHSNLHLWVTLHQCVGAIFDQRGGQRAGNNVQAVGQHQAAVVFQFL